MTMATNAKTTTLILPPPTCAPALLNANAAEKKLYWDRSHYDSPEAQTRALARSSTVYVGNLAFTTRSTHLRHHFQHLGPVVQVHIGLDRNKKTPCGFAFVEFRHRIDALSAVVNLTGTKLDGRVIRVELDAGFKPGRQYGRGASGGQVRDDRGGGSGRDRRNNNSNTSGGGGGGNDRPRWEPPSAPKADDVGHYGRGGAGDVGNNSDSLAGEKRGREDAPMEENDENPSAKNQKMYDYDDDENL